MSNESNSSKFDVEIRFEDGGNQLLKTARRITGLVRIKHIGKLINTLDLDANPRNSKVGPVTRAILETLEMSPDLYPIKSKGILLGASQYSFLDGEGRVGLNFENRKLEGVLDGGHNMLAIGLFLLSNALDDGKQKKEVAKVKNWIAFKELHDKYREQFDVYLSSGKEELQIKAWVELILPPSEDDIAVEKFEGVLLEIQDARNNNAQLSQVTKTDKQGYFEELKRFLDADIASKVEWKENDGGTIKAADLIALTWIPLSALELFPKDADGKNVMPPSPVSLYASKATGVNRFDEFMSCESITTTQGAEVSLDSLPVRSAMRLAADMPRIHDYITAHIARSYNRNGARYGSIAAVASKNKGTRDPRTKYTGQLIDKNSPDGFIAPLVYAMKALVLKHDDGTVEWAMDPNEFLNSSLDSMVDILRDFILNTGDDTSADPQKIGKNASVYTSCFQAAKIALIEAKMK